MVMLGNGRVSHGVDLVRIIEPASTLDCSRVLCEIGINSMSYRTSTPFGCPSTPRQSFVGGLLQCARHTPSCSCGWEPSFTTS